MRMSDIPFGTTDWAAITPTEHAGESGNERDRSHGRVWMKRFEGGEAPSTNLDAILYGDFDALREARAIEDTRIQGYVDSLGADSLRGTIAYVNNVGREFRDSVDTPAGAPFQPPDPPSRAISCDADADRGVVPRARHAPRADSRTGQARSLHLNPASRAGLSPPATCLPTIACVVCHFPLILSSVAFIVSFHINSGCPV